MAQAGRSESSSAMSHLEIATERIELNVAGSGLMGAYVAQPAGTGPHPGLIVFQEAYGVNSHIRNVTDRFAAQGFVAIGAKKKPHVNVEFSNADHAFFCDERAAYEPNAARQSWALTLEFLRS